VQPEVLTSTTFSSRAVFSEENDLVSRRTEKEELLSTDGIWKVYCGKIRPEPI